MGTDKALIPHATGIPMALYAAGELAKMCDVVSLVGDPAKYSELGLPVVADRFPGAGPLGGIEAALITGSVDWNLIVACDMPSLHVAIFEALVEVETDPSAACALPQHEDGQVEPLCAMYHRRCHPVILAALERGIRKITVALQPLEIRYVRVPSGAPFSNLNTPQELQKYRNG